MTLKQYCSFTALALVVSASSAADPSDGKKQQPDFRSPIREYDKVEIDGLNIFVEAQLFVEDPGLAKKATKRLALNINKAFAVFPAHVKSLLGEMPFYLMYGTKARGGGKDNGLEYFQRNAPEHHAFLDERWASAIVVYSAKNYTTLSDVWALKAVVHELAHAYHLEQWSEQQPDILAAWKRAMEAGLHHNMLCSETERMLEKSYAATNQLEYFAELSCMYFAECNYHPINRSELETYDPGGYKMIQKMWKDLNDEEHPPKESTCDEDEPESSPGKVQS